MKGIASPYNFVPLNKYVYIPEWWNKVSNDIPFCDGEDGYIEFTFSSISPLFTRNGSDSKNEKYSAHVPLSDGKRLYFLPGSSIKGMLRSTLEILSFGKMEQYNDRYFGYRTFNEKENDYKTYHSIITDQKCGWLQKEGESYSLIPCKGEFESIEISEIPQAYISILSKKKGVGDRNKAIAKKTKELYPAIDRNGRRCRLVCTGKMNSKKHEYLFPCETNEPISLMDRRGEKRIVLKQFLSIYAQNKDATDFINEYLEKGQRIHVFYVTDEHDDIVAMGLSKMMKLPYSNGIKNLVENRQEVKQERDLCETIFGYITEGEKNLKGRVQVCNAFCVDKSGKELAIADNDLIMVSGVLGEPKPSFYPFYVEQKSSDGSYKTYEDAETIAGRKFYRIHEGSSVSNLPKGNGNDNVATSFFAIPRGISFKCRINIHNLKSAEIGALLSAIILEKGSYHNIGMAKSFGYGKLECSDIKLNLKNTIDEYIAAFKCEMQKWGKEVHHDNNWDYDKRIEIATLLAIKKEHSNEDVRMLEMQKPTGKIRSDGKPQTENEFLNVKKNFQVLNENLDVSSMQSDLEEESLRKKEEEKLARNKAKNEWKRKQKEESETVSTKVEISSDANTILSFTEQLAHALSVGQLAKMIEKQYKNEGRHHLSEEELLSLTKGILSVIDSLKKKMSKTELIQKGTWSADGSIWKKVADIVGQDSFTAAFPKINYE